jgi:hypothetical protein
MSSCPRDIIDPKISTCPDPCRQSIRRGTSNPDSSKYQWCADETNRDENGNYYPGTCNFSGKKKVFYGVKDDNGVAKYANTVGATDGNNSIPCSNGIFGDPFGGTCKFCYVEKDQDTVSDPVESFTVVGRDFDNCTVLFWIIIIAIIIYLYSRYKDIM